MIIKSRFASTFAAAALAAFLMPAVQAATPISNGKVSNSDNQHIVIEPVTTAQTVNGVEWYSTAFMRFTGSASSNNPDVQIFTSATSNPALWPAPSVVPNALEKSGDPVLVQSATNALFGPGNIYLVGTSWNGMRDAKNPNPNLGNPCLLENRIMLWSSPNGGQTWTSKTIHQNVVGSHYFDDKPTVYVSKYSRTPGMVYVAFRRVNVIGAETRCPSTGPGEDGIYIYQYEPNSGTATFLARAVDGAAAHNPQLFQDPWNGTLFLAWMDFSDLTVRVKQSSDLGSTWAYPYGIPQYFYEPGLMGPQSAVCDDSNVCVYAALGMSVSGNPAGQTFGFAYQRKKSGTRANASEVMFRVFNPFALSGFSTPAVEVNRSGDHYTWLPAIDAQSNGRYLVTYYDYDHGAPGANTYLTYKLSATTLEMDGTWVRDDVLFDNVASDPHATNYGLPAPVGEYQGLFFYNGVFNAVTVYFKNNIGDIYHVRATP